LTGTPPGDGLRPATRAVRGGLERTGFAETAEALFLTSGYVYASAEEAEAAFAEEIDHYVYSRYGNPTVTMFEERLRQIEGAEDCFATASGMAAVFNALLAELNTGDHIVASRALFGPCVVVLRDLLPRWGITTTFVDGHDLDQWRVALAEPTNAVFFESPSNPMQDIIDMAAVCDLAHEAGATVFVDNVFATPVLQRPLEFGVDVVVYSATKHIDGQGRVLGGAVLGSREFIRTGVEPLVRHTGPCISPFNAWVLGKSLETMALRVEAAGRGALRIAGALEEHPRVASVRYPYLPSHPQHELATRQMSGGGTVVTFTIAGDDADGRRDAFAMLDALRLIDISNNLGDAKSLITHPATTTHRKLSADERRAAGISDATVRLSVGLEDPADLLDDLGQALDAVG